MSNTILVGFERKVGNFTNKSTGEVVNYSNRIIHFISDDGANSDNIGYAFLDVKLKLAELSSLLNVREDDTSVDDMLKSLINKHVVVKWAPRNGELVVVGLSEVKRS